MPIKQIEQISFNSQHLLFDADILIDTVKLKIQEDFNKVFSTSTNCIIPVTKLELLNTKNKRDFLLSSKLIDGFWELPMTTRDHQITEKVLEHSINLKKAPSIGDFYLAAKALSYGSNSVFLLTANIQDFSSKLFSIISVFEIQGEGHRKLWTVLKPKMHYDEKNKALVKT